MTLEGLQLNHVSWVPLNDPSLISGLCGRDFGVDETIYNVIWNGNLLSEGFFNILSNFSFQTNLLINCLIHLELNESISMISNL
jgi:hypothetical protein